ncbi:hypothetical protein CYLTODRAFT_491237 [Cylindrobasidium torrendii FP15055 ss-10]|uniref:F-box domain-containing protein n=1 Tax=Cylindrobasidium torrendii FP15055 ss-10 TaxID=1314674 RepID=A0A0D7B894_9AGAR|nr:hypothetical protein CYLTODRAFT_491237 [Cylindrobasidium torrendii FP15055 ss-10]
MLLDLPQELLDAIVDQASGDLDTIRACSLACSQFTRQSQAHLFSSVTLTQPFECLALFERICGSPRLAIYVRRLVVAPAVRTPNATLGDVSKEPLLRTLIETFTNLEHVELVGGDIMCPLPNFPSPLAAIFKHDLTSLDLCGVSFPSDYRHLFAVARAFPRLAHFGCTDPKLLVVQASLPVENTDELEEGPMVKSLATGYDFWDDHVVSCLLRTRTCPVSINNLRILKFSIGLNRNIPSLIALLKICEGTLEELTVSVTGHGYSANTFEPIPIRALRRVTFVGNTTTVSVNTENYFLMNWYCKSLQLAGGTNCRLAEVELYAVSDINRCFVFADLTVACWSLLDKTLSDKRDFPELTAFYVSVASRRERYMAYDPQQAGGKSVQQGGPSPILDEFRGMLKRLAESGVARVYRIHNNAPS